MDYKHVNYMEILVKHKEFKHLWILRKISIILCWLLILLLEDLILKKLKLLLIINYLYNLLGIFIESVGQLELEVLERP